MTKRAGTTIVLGVILGSILVRSGISLSTTQAQTAAQATISLHPQSPSTHTSTQNLKIVIHPNTATITAAKLVIRYDNTQIRPQKDSITTGPYLSRILPNCHNQATPCPENLVIDDNQLVFFLAVDCSANGCTIPQDSTTPFTLATIPFERISSVTKTLLTVSMETTNPSQVAALESDADVLATTNSTHLSFNTCELPFDIIPNNRIDIQDVMQVANVWNASIGNQAYNGQTDLNTDYVIDIKDIQAIANQWSNSCI